ncbi:MAG: DUF3142 domain-containing protein [Pontiellaceae bacterium]|nr:DUF3142 domain-containing protein [Pontiellaceae bacterium]MBN2783496.1 DUF3142 domain-containing protein [Pontiellaceae bacterium]
MKFSAAILCLLLLPLMSFSDRNMDRYYVWQQAWSTNVQQAVYGEAPTTLYPVASVIPATGESRMVDIPWNKLANSGHGIIPVIRIPLKAFRREDIEKELNRITQSLMRDDNPCRISEIQFDLDCPERMLPDYLKLVSDYRKTWANLRLSITVLPCHLDNRTFRPLAEAVDSFVLQVHGLDVPDQLDEKAELLNRKIAERAIRKAEALKRPYRVALPCYAYELNFDTENGRFLFLTAEGPGRRENTIRKRIAADPADLLYLQKMIHLQKHSEGVIWFRLPVEGDRLCLPRPELTRLQRGEQPTGTIICRAVPVSSTTMELEIINTGIIDQSELILKIDWPQDSGAFDLYHSVQAASPSPGRLPPRIQLSVPSPGQPQRIGWFQTAKPPTVTIEYP